MFGSIFTFELRRLLRSLSTYIYFFVLFAVTFLVALMAGGAFPDVKFNTGGDKIFANSPLVIDAFFGQINNYIGLIILVAMVGNAVLKDFKYNTYSMIFTTPVSRFSYLSGRFSASMLVTLLVLSAPAFGMMLGYVMPMVNPDRIGAFALAPYVTSYVYTVVPNAIVFGTIFFAVSLISRDIFVIWLSLIVFFVVNGVAGSFFGELEHQSIAAIADPMGNFAKTAITKFWSTWEKNHLLLPLQGYFLINRIMWLCIAAGVWTIGYRFFSFSSAPRRISFRKAVVSEPSRVSFVPSLFRRDSLPEVRRSFGTGALLGNLWGLSVNECATLLRNVYFRIIILFGMLLLFLVSLQMGEIYETTTLPVTYQVVENFGGTFTLFIVILTILFGGELVWRERDFRMSNITDALPVPNWAFYASKMCGLIFMQVILLGIIMLCGIVVQLSKGYTHLEPMLYMEYLLGIILPDMMFLAVLSVFVQTIVRNKYLGYFIIALFYFWNSVFAPLVLKHNLLIFSSNPTVLYSDMNGFGHSVWPYFVFKLYWGAFCVGIAGLTSLLWARGTEKSVKLRISEAFHSVNKKSWMLVAGSFTAFFLCGGFIYYNTNVLNDYKSNTEQEKEQVAYEKTYRRYRGIPQPKITDVKLAIDLYPVNRSLHATGSYVLQNKTMFPIDSIHVMMPGELKVNKMFLGRSFKEVYRDSAIADYRILKLDTPLMPGAGIALQFDIEMVSRGFEHGFTGLSTPLYNGTFINNQSFLPSIGYNEQYELADNADRKKYGLAYRQTANKIDDAAALQRNLFIHDADFVTFDATISTERDQIAVAPGYLQKEWEQNGRKFFHYKMDSRILNFYSFLSARYKVKKDVWNGVNLEIYYHPGHEYNLDRMMSGIKKALSYYTASFSNYQHKQVRILEFPRYATFAQSFPNTIPFSEGIGFIADVNAKKADDVDYPFYVTAHEVAHQWFAHQVIGADVEGSNILSESLAQYGAIMVLEREYGEDKLRKFLKIEMDNYLRSRSGESEKEKPWAYADAGQTYILYQKGGIQMHALNKYLGEDSMNIAVKRFVEKFAFKGPPYPTTRDLVASIRQSTPDSLQYFVTDLFEKITIFNSKISDAKRIAVNGGYEVELTVDIDKTYSDGSGNVSKAPGTSYVEIGVYKDRSTMISLNKYKLHQGANKLKIAVGERPYKVVLDPRVLLIDKNVDDNEFKVGKPSELAKLSRKRAKS